MPIGLQKKKLQKKKPYRRLMKKSIPAVLAAVFMLAGCGGNKPAARSADVPAVNADTQSVVKFRAVTAAEIGKTAICPVTKDTIVVTRDTPTADYKGKTYFFCCTNCPVSFSRNPDKYAK